MFAYIVIGICEYNTHSFYLQYEYLNLHCIFISTCVNLTLHCIMVDNELFKQIAVLKVLTCIYYCTMCRYNIQLYVYIGFEHKTYPIICNAHV